MSRFNWAIAVMFGALPVPACAQTLIPEQYQVVANRHDIPPAILYAIALAESGWTVQGLYRPWPWTLNIDGKGHRYSNHHSAARELHAAVARGINVDVGLMQISARWHSHRVERIEQLLNPFTNLEQGAAVLREQYLRSSDWWEAVGRYHSPANTQKARERAQRYRQRVYKLYLTVTGEKHVKH